MLTQTFHGHVTPEDKARHDYLYVPFDLPFAAQRLTVRYAYSRPMHHSQVQGGNVIDIGIFGPQGNDFPGAPGFRGWSGSDRSTFTITPHEATPGYLPGPLPAGRYQVGLGLYRICPEGADYEVEVEAVKDDGGRTADRGPRTSYPDPTSQLANHPITQPSNHPTTWLKGDLQSHTFHSDGKGSPQLLVEKARALGLDFLAITDHNTISHHPALAQLSDERLLLIQGQEVTTYYGHMNVWGTSRWCDFRARNDKEMAAIIDLAHRHGALCSINHPKEGGPPWTYSTELAVDTMEVWQGPWPNRNEESLALWDRLLRQGRRLPAVGGSDYHCPAAEERGLLRLGQPTTWVKAATRSPEAILATLQAGRTAISASPDGPRLDLFAGRSASGEQRGMGELLSLEGEAAHVTVDISGGNGPWQELYLHLITEDGVVYKEWLNGERQTVTTQITARRYIRAELVGDMSPDRLPENVPTGLDLHGWRWALSNPIYVNHS